MVLGFDGHGACARPFGRARAGHSFAVTHDARQQNEAVSGRGYHALDFQAVLSTPPRTLKSWQIRIRISMEKLSAYETIVSEMN